MLKNQNIVNSEKGSINGRRVCLRLPTKQILEARIYTKKWTSNLRDHFGRFFWNSQKENMTQNEFFSGYLRKIPQHKAISVIQLFPFKTKEAGNYHTKDAPAIYSSCHCSFNINTAYNQPNTHKLQKTASLLFRCSNSLKESTVKSIWYVF